MLKFKIGQLVKIKKCKVGKQYGNYIFIEEMEKYVNKVSEIDSVFRDCYHLDIDRYRYPWTDEMLEPVKENKEMKECQTCNTIKESRPTPEGDEICPNCGDREMMDYEPKSLDELEVGDWVERIGGRKMKIVEIKLMKLYTMQFENSIINYYTAEDLERADYKPCHPPTEKIEIDGKTYLKDEVLEAVKNLKEIL